MVVGIVAAAIGLVALAGVVLASGTHRSPVCRSTLVPAYVGPSELISLAERPHRPRVVVINPDSGPGARRDAAYAEAVRRAREAGLRVLGYVATGYGARSVADVGADVDRYARWYGVDGIFLDETAHTADLVAHYWRLAQVVRGDGAGLVVLNPGVVPAIGYFRFADVVVTFEGTADEYAAALARTPAWLQSFAPEQIAHLVYGASREQAVAAVGASSGAGYVYITSGTLPNPWQTVPDYLEEEEALLAACASS